MASPNNRPPVLAGHILHPQKYPQKCSHLRLNLDSEHTYKCVLTWCVGWVGSYSPLFITTSSRIMSAADEKTQMADAVKSNSELQTALSAVILGDSKTLIEQIESDPVGVLCDALLTSTPLSLAVSSSNDRAKRHHVRTQFARRLNRFSPLYPDIAADALSSKRLPARIVITALLRQLAAAQCKLAEVTEFVEEIHREAQRSPTPATQSP